MSLSLSLSLSLSVAALKTESSRNNSVFLFTQILNLYNCYSKQQELSMHTHTHVHTAEIHSVIADGRQTTRARKTDNLGKHKKAFISTSVIPRAYTCTCIYKPLVLHISTSSLTLAQFRQTHNIRQEICTAQLLLCLLVLKTTINLVHVHVRAIWIATTRINKLLSIKATNIL